MSSDVLSASPRIAGTNILIHSLLSSNPSSVGQQICFAISCCDQFVSSSASSFQLTLARPQHGPFTLGMLTPGAHQPQDHGEMELGNITCRLLHNPSSEHAQGIASLTAPSVGLDSCALRLSADLRPLRVSRSMWTACNQTLIKASICSCLILQVILVETAAAGIGSDCRAFHWCVPKYGRVPMSHELMRSFQQR